MAKSLTQEETDFVERFTAMLEERLRRRSVWTTGEVMVQVGLTVRDTVLAEPDKKVLSE